MSPMDSEWMLAVVLLAEVELAMLETDVRRDWSVKNSNWTIFEPFFLSLTWNLEVKEMTRVY